MVMPGVMVVPGVMVPSIVPGVMVPGVPMVCACAPDTPAKARAAIALPIASFCVSFMLVFLRERF